MARNLYYYEPGAKEIFIGGVGTFKVGDAGMVKVDDDDTAVLLLMAHPDKFTEKKGAPNVPHVMERLSPPSDEIVTTTANPAEPSGARAEKSNKD